MSYGFSFGYGELRADEPLLGEGNIISWVGEEGYMIGGTKGTLKEGDINPLTKDKIVK